MLRYIELKSGHSDNGPARIGARDLDGTKFVISNAILPVDPADFVDRENRKP